MVGTIIGYRKIKGNLQSEKAELITTTLSLNQLQTVRT